MLAYRNKNLVKIGEKLGGKNIDPMNGFFRDEEGHEFFIKKPNDKCEMFTELFAGMLLTEFKNIGIISDTEAEILICAGYIRFNEGSYGLIQPKIRFDELHKLLYPNKKERDPLSEMMSGVRDYARIVDFGDLNSLAVCLMYSMILGDYSFHSGNIVLLNSDRSPVLRDDFELIKKCNFGRIDWGAAFRLYGDLENDDVLCPAEYKRSLMKSYTKSYISFYTPIPGLFELITQLAKKLVLNQRDFNEETIKQCLIRVIYQIPKDMFTQNDKEKISSCISIPSILKVFNGNEVHDDLFAVDMAKIIYTRTCKIAKLTAEAVLDFKLKQKDLEIAALIQQYEALATLRQNNIAAHQQEIANIRALSDQTLAAHDSNNARLINNWRETAFQQYRVGMRWGTGLSFFSLSLMSMGATGFTHLNIAGIVLATGPIMGGILIGAGIVLCIISICMYATHRTKLRNQFILFPPIVNDQQNQPELKYSDPRVNI